MSWPSLPTLVSLLKLDPSQQNAKQATQEASLLEDVAVQFSNTYDFTSANTPASKLFKELFDALIDFRLAKESWRKVLKSDHLMRVLQCTRLLSRDTALRRRFVERGAVQVVGHIFDVEAKAHFAGSITPFQIETLTEIASIIKRLAGDDWGLKALVNCGVHGVLTQLLNSNDPAVLPLVLVALIGFAAHKEHYRLVAHAHSLEVLLRIVQQYDLPFKRLAADLLALLARREDVVSELLVLNGLGRIVGQLQTGDTHLTQSLLRVVCYMASDMSALQELYQVGSIPVLVSLVGSAAKDMGNDPALPCVIPGGTARITELQLAATALTRISEDDEMAVQIRACNGVTVLGKLLLAQPEPSSDPQEAERSSREVASLKTYVFRALRYIFSMERNRKVFKRLFPPDLFAAFIDVGHYNTSLSTYVPLVQRFDELSEKQKAGVAAALEDVSADRDDSLRTVHGYVILEMLGKGAYGAVYKARRSRGDTLVALKELPLTDVGIFGATDAERVAGVGRMGKEVEILSSLSHPNIVQYYESFTEGPYLYIAMELVEGISLLDHLNSLAGKNRRMPEADIWQVLIAVSLALNYIHGQKKIVHRDLTPANIVLGQGPEGLRSTKIADFGLAKQMSSSVVAQSVVGTMPYTCPEIIQQEHYSEKADIWSLGCVMYHAMMLKPPFDGTNPLSVASKIVEGSYEPLSDPPGGPAYSLHLKQLVKAMMTVEPQRRPGIEEVGGLIAGQLMMQMERMTISEQRLVRALQVERSHRRGNALFADNPGSPALGTPSRGGGTAATIHRRIGGLGLHDGSPTGSPLAGAAARAGLGETAGLRAPHPLDLDGVGSGEVSSDSASTPPAGGGTGIFIPPPSAGVLTTTARTVSIATSRLRPVTDPLTQILSQLHKVLWVEQLPPGLQRDHRRRCVELFRRHLFGAGSSASTVKAQLVKLLASDADIIRDPMGRPVDFGNVTLNEGSSEGSRDGSLTYDQLHQAIESILLEKGYSSGPAISEQELLEALP
eukprot:CAMPEP_0202909088 /NCGR_PEP_ID=MMETSP1392-20130828/48237_1 /ASSEMBLY_ACC=CAM_ASM_000868 /TAXON_ID=225041 /ORGANISM="Chlamydomonas chlamydogama, Strain SAG 11-48b" /LENGTH=1008 /DNA_ID=CAMNT_0049598709 /DNA_START=59 /DNA_END=3081 /DNA_ORIENTATION=-